MGVVVCLPVPEESVANALVDCVDRGFIGHGAIVTDSSLPYRLHIAYKKAPAWGSIFRLSLGGDSARWLAGRERAERYIDRHPLSCPDELRSMQNAAYAGAQSMSPE